jgi:cysteine-rich repeat protein
MLTKNNIPSKIFLLTLAGILFLSGFFVFQRQSAEAQSDAIAVRVFTNYDHLSPSAWYRSKGFQGNPTPIKVDGYDAVQDGRTVYVNVANVVSSGKCYRSGTNCQNDADCGGGTCDGSPHCCSLTSTLYTNIYLISYNQDAGANTISIFNKILANWKFNTNLTEPGTCFKPQTAAPSCASQGDCSSPYSCVIPSGSTAGTCQQNCLADSDCASGYYCNSSKAATTRDVNRLAALNDLKAAIESYQSRQGHYPLLSSGTFQTGKTVSTWPSWNSEFASELGAATPVDPINKLGDCGGSQYDPNTCWDAIGKTFAGTIPDSLPPQSYVFAYSTDATGQTYNACSNMETGLISQADGACRGKSISSQSPVINCDNLIGSANQPFIGYVKVTDPANQPLTSFEIYSLDNSFTVSDAGDPNQKKITAAAPVASVNPYTFAVSVTDAAGNGSRAQCSINITSQSRYIYPIPDQRVAVDKILNFTVYAYNSTKDYTGLDFNFNSPLSMRCNGPITILTDGRAKCDVSVSAKSPGEYQVIVSAGPSYTSQQFKLNVVDNPPVMKPINCAPTVRVGQAYSCQLSATDPEGQMVRFVLGGDVPPGLSNGSTVIGSAMITGVPNLAKATPFNIIVTPFDVPYYVSGASSSFSLQVNNYCGDGTWQSPNFEGKGGRNNDGFEDCDCGNYSSKDCIAHSSETNVSKSDNSTVLWQYGCKSNCSAANDGWCGDNVSQDGEYDLFKAASGRESVLGKIIQHGKVDYGEQCDDGNAVDGDGCNTDSAKCQYTCGDGAVNDGLYSSFPPGGIKKENYVLWGEISSFHSRAIAKNDASQVEQCDDGNNIDGDGCNTFTAKCQHVCGDGHLDANEQCDVERKDAATAENLGGKKCQDSYGPIAGRRWDGGALHCVASTCQFDTGHCVYYDDVSGHVGQALNGSNAPGVIVSVNYDGTTYSGTSDASGNFVIKNVPHRAPTTHVISTSGGSCAFADRSKSGNTSCLSTSQTSIMNGPLSGLQFYVFPSDWAGQYAFVLSWDGPTDLDSHLSFGSNHIYYRSRSGGGSSLDWDDRTSSGHEVISINQIAAGSLYSYYVNNYGHQYSNKANFNTTANVKVFHRDASGASLLSQFPVYSENNSSNYWNVMSFTGSASTIEPITLINSYGNGSTISISGSVMNAITGDPIAGATASIQFDNKESLTFSAVSNASGNFVIANIPNNDVMTETRTMTITASGFKKTTEDLSLAASSPNKPYYLFPDSWTGNAAIVLNWNNPPRDLDAHLNYYTCEISYMNKGVECLGLMLDRDDQNVDYQDPPDNDLTKGQETISRYSTVTVGGEANSLHDYYVDNYSGGNFNNSIRVRFFVVDGNGNAQLVRECTAENRPEKYWDVFRFYDVFYDPSDNYYQPAGVTCKNTYSYTAP